MPTRNRETTMASRNTKHPDLDYVLLCLIRMHPDISGYQLRGIINDSTGFFFHAHLSQIYPALKRLTEEGLLQFSVVVRDSQPDLKLYRITEKGSRASHDWLCQPYPFERTRTSIDHYFLKLILMGHLEPADIVSFIDQGIATLADYREAIARDNLSTELSFVASLDETHRDRYAKLWGHEFDYILHEFDERIAWLNELRREFDAD